MRTCNFLFILSVFLFNIYIGKSQQDSSIIWFLQGNDTIVTCKNVKINNSLFAKDSIVVNKLIVNKTLKVGNSIYLDHDIFTPAGVRDRIRVDNEDNILSIFGDYDDVTVSPIKVGIGTYTPLNYGDPENNVGLEVNGQINLTDATGCPVNSPDATNNKINAYRIRGVPVLSIQRQATLRNIFSFNFIYPILTI